MNTTVISGWGGYPTQEALVLRPLSPSDCQRLLRAAGKEKDKTIITRGMGRSYGDSANAAQVLSATALEHFLDFDPATGVLTAEAGLTLRAMLGIIVPQGWFLPVTPGTSFVTLGGAIASDVHGKNHHIAGTFGQHVLSMTVLLGTGEVVTTSPTQLPDLFQATCGGMGLTGVILSATIQLIPIASAWIDQTTVRAANLEEIVAHFEAYKEATYSVAWIDCLAKGRALGKSVLMLGEHAKDGGAMLKMKNPLTVPMHAPAVLLNRFSVGAFNALYYAKARHNRRQRVSLLPYFYPLDAIGGWNKLYGKAGFVQYQCVLPKDNGLQNLRAVLTKIAESGLGSFLAVLKQFGPANQHLLSFPMEGYTLALDFKCSAHTFALLQALDALVLSVGGRLYLSKDALMSEAMFKQTYPRWQEFEDIRQRYDAVGAFASAQSKRLGLA